MKSELQKRGQNKKSCDKQLPIPQGRLLNKGYTVITFQILEISNEQYIKYIVISNSSSNNN